MDNVSQRSGSQAYMSAPRLVVLISALLLSFSAIASAEKPADQTPFHKTPFIKTWNTTYPPFEDQGPLLDGADRVGSYVVGIPGMIISLPVGVGGAIVSQLTDNDFDSGFDASVNTISSGFGIAGKYLIGVPVYLLKAVFYDAPKAALTSDSKYTKDISHGSPKVRR